VFGTLALSNESSGYRWTPWWEYKRKSGGDNNSVDKKPVACSSGSIEVSSRGEKEKEGLLGCRINYMAAAVKG